MIGLLAPLLAASAVGALALAARPHRIRRALEAAPGLAPPPPGLGRAVRRSLRLADDPWADRLVGPALLVAMVSVTVVPGLVVVGPLVALVAPVVRRRRRADRERAVVITELPGVIDLLRLALSSTGSVRLAVLAAGECAPGAVGQALRDAGGRVAGGERLAAALEASFAPLGAPTEPLVRALVGAERYGVPLDGALERLGQEARARRRRHVEAAARRMPVQLLAPLALCMLPAFVLLTIVPILARTLTGLPVR